MAVEGERRLEVRNAKTDIKNRQQRDLRHAAGYHVSARRVDGRALIRRA